MKRRSSYQQKLIRNYYEHRDAIMLQSLGELVSELYLTGDEFKRRRLWSRVEKALRNLGTKEEEISRLVASRDLAALARLVGREF